MSVLLLNGSPHEHGSTYTALRYVADAIEESGLEAEIVHLANTPLRGCSDCGICRKRKSGLCSIEGDIVNIILEKMEKADGLVVGSPVYYASPNGHMLAVLDRFFQASQGLHRGKPAAAICVARRAGTTSTIDALNKYFQINGMPIASSNYWPMVHGWNADDVREDAEGIQTMQLLGANLAWMIKCFAEGRKAGIPEPKIPGGRKIFTDFIHNLDEKSINMMSEHR